MGLVSRRKGIKRLQKQIARARALIRGVLDLFDLARQCHDRKGGGGPGKEVELLRGTEESNRG